MLDANRTKASRAVSSLMDGMLPVVREEHTVGHEVRPGYMGHGVQQDINQAVRPVWLLRSRLRHGEWVGRHGGGKESTWSRE